MSYYYTAIKLGFSSFLSTSLTDEGKLTKKTNCSGRFCLAVCNHVLLLNRSGRHRMHVATVLQSALPDGIFYRFLHGVLLKTYHATDENRFLQTLVLTTLIITLVGVTRV